MSGAEERRGMPETAGQAERPAEKTLERIVFIGRTYDEYMRMFGLDESDLEGKRILDCPGGACSFAAKAGELGCEVTAADIAYYHEADRLLEKELQDIGHAMEHVESEQSRYIWTEFPNSEALRSERLRALRTCAEDMKVHPERYVPVTLPSLPFRDEQFDLTLSAHFLFTYADRMDAEFHRDVLRELLRVTRGEVRIFPLVDQSGRRPGEVEQLIAFARGEGWSAETKAVPYHFQRQADHVLILRAGGTIL
ncbi:MULTISPECIES: methyltransferase domain-containing protein [Paenibacillus]|nr:MULTISPECIES: methyltransferase domain-containing protein [Paenibacillus]